MSRHIVRACQLDAESGGLVLEYLTPETDVRSNGMVLNRALLVPPEDAHLPLIELVEATLQTVLEAALKGFEQATGDDPPEDDGPAPFDNPEER